MTVTTRKFAHSAVMFLLMLLHGNYAYAAPGTLSTAPLFVSTAVEPNIFLTLDDSGSMFWEMMFSDGTAGFTSDNGVPLVGNTLRRYWNPDWYTDTQVMPPTSYVHSNPAVTWDDDMWVMRNHNGNKIYYNPESNYTPWQGVDALGNPLYTNANPTAVLFHPNQALTTDITQQYNFYDYDDCNCWLLGALYIPSYYIWNDTNADPALAGNGIIDASDDHVLIEIRPTTPVYPSGRTYAEEIQNFANWYQYYIKRDYSSKAAIGGVINNTDATRMGLDIFNRGHQVDVKSMTLPANKRALLNAFYNVPTGGGTPARNSLKRVGELFRSTGATAPILDAAGGGECQQNFNILMTDGFWNGGTPTGIGNTDLDTSGIADNGFDGNVIESIDDGNYEDPYSNTLADVAMHYYENDLRTDLNNNVPTQPDIDEADHQHLVTYTVAFGLTGTLDPAVDNPRDAGFAWPDAAATDANRIDDLWHAAYNGRGQYLTAQNPEELQTALGIAIDDIAERTATASAASVTSARLTTDSVVFLSEFNTNRWQGTIFAFQIADLDLGLLSTTPLWSASDELDARNLTTDDRVIMTYDNTADASSVGDGVPFRWANITADMKADLRTNTAGGVDPDTTAQSRLDYIRGDRSNEGQGLFFRERASLLGDIVHSGPVFVAKPNLLWPDEAPFPTGGSAYSEFKTLKENRDGAIYVGANDGMIHGFDEDTGREILAYIPSNVFSVDNGKGLHYLTQQNYIHMYYNDLTPTVSDIYIGNGANTAWHTIMIAGQRGGGRGYAALDITDPNSFSEANAADTVMWEFTDRDDPDLGFTFSRPQIGMTNDGEWVAVFGNGYNNTGDGQAKLFIVKIEKGLDGNWAANDYTEISTGTGTLANKNGLATPALADLDGNGTIDRAYAGDLDGKLWVFDLSGPTTGSWGLAYGASPLFTTIGNRPITSQPSLSFHPTVALDGTNAPNVMVAVGSGQFMVEADKSSTHQNYFYGVWDMGQSNLTSANLVEQTYRAGFAERVLTKNPVDYTIFRGWYLSLPDSGERAITNSIIRSGIVFFNTAIPSSDACSVGGFGFRFAVDLETGGTPDEPVIDQNDDGKVDSNDTIGVLKDVASAQKYNRLLTDDTITERHIINERELKAIQTAPTRQVGRISWQELLQ